MNEPTRCPCPWCSATGCTVQRQHDDGTEFICPACKLTHTRKPDSEAAHVFFPGDIPSGRIGPFHLTVADLPDAVRVVTFDAEGNWQAVGLRCSTGSHEWFSGSLATFLRERIEFLGGLQMVCPQVTIGWADGPPQ